MSNFFYYFKKWQKDFLPNLLLCENKDQKILGKLEIQIPLGLPENLPGPEVTPSPVAPDENNYIFLD